MMGFKFRIEKYKSPLATFIDGCTFLLTYPWLTVLSLFLGCYWSTTQERKHPGWKGFQYLVLGPIFGALVAMAFPVYFVGQTLWILLCVFAAKDDFALVKIEDVQDKEPQHEEASNEFTVATANVLLGFDILGKFNNQKFVYSRMKKIADSFVTMGNRPLNNLSILNANAEEEANLYLISISPNWPKLDFICFQEVWDRFFTGVLMNKLQQHFKYHVVDVGHYSWRVNSFMGSSGLMIVSRYPILKTHYHYFKNKKSWQWFISYGAIMVKVDLGVSKDNRQRVGYITNVHSMAYQGKEDQTSVAFSEIQSEIKKFRKLNDLDGEDVLFSVIAGDLNNDNISPGDRIAQNHDIFKQFLDVCSIGPGKDKPWAIGTEHRQMQMFEPEVSDPVAMKEMLMDDVNRRRFIIDADVQAQTFDLMVCQPKLDSDGVLRAKPYGGKRRIDRILHDKDCPAVPCGYSFVTAIAGQTDHIPVCMSLKVDDEGT